MTHGKWFGTRCSALACAIWTASVTVSAMPPSPPALFALLGDVDGDRFGHAVLLLPDLDKDGHAEILVGAPEGSWGGMSGGFARLYSGRTRGVIRTHGAPTAGAEFGFAVSNAFDVDGDFISDYAVGAPGADSVQVYSGATGDVLTVLHGPVGSRFGSSLAPALANGEIIQPTLAVGLPEDSAGGMGAGSVRRFASHSGELLTWDFGTEDGAALGSAIASDLYSSVFAGAPGSSQATGHFGMVFDLSTWFRPDIFSHAGGESLSPSGGFGSSVAHVPVVSCQGVSVDHHVFLVGAPGSGVERGSVTVVEPSQPIDPDEVIKSFEVGDGFGSAMDGAGAVLDGCTQGVVIGAPWMVPGGSDDAYVALYDLFGSAELFRISAEPTPPTDRFALSSVADIDGDGRNNLVLGLPHLGAGEVRIYSLGVPELADRFSLGDRIFGTVEAPGEFRELCFDAVKGTKIRFFASAMTNALPLRITLFDPVGELVKTWTKEVGAIAKTLKAKAKKNGSYRLRVESEGGALGSWTLLTEGKWKKNGKVVEGKVKGSPHVVSFLAVAGATANGAFESKAGEITAGSIELLRPDGTPHPGLAGALHTPSSGEWISFDTLDLDQAGRYEVVISGLGSGAKVKYGLVVGVPDSRRQILTP